MLELVISVCLVADPIRCKDVSLTNTEGTPMACMMAAPIEIARWSEYHPRWVAKRWTCSQAGQVAKI